MPPKIRFSNEEIVNAAFDLVAEEGWKALTAMRLAKKLGCSVQPLYREFRSLTDIKKAVVERMVDLNLEYTQRHYSDNSLENYTIGNVFFALDHPKLQAALLQLEPQYWEIAVKLDQDTFQQIKADPLFKEVTNNRLAIMFQHLSFYVFAFASMVCANSLPPAPKEEYEKLLAEAVRILSTIMKPDFAYDESIKLRTVYYRPDSK